MAWAWNDATACFKLQVKTMLPDGEIGIIQFCLKQVLFKFKNSCSGEPGKPRIVFFNRKRTTTFKWTLRKVNTVCHVDISDNRMYANKEVLQA